MNTQNTKDAVFICSKINQQVTFRAHFASLHDPDGGNNKEVASQPYQYECTGSKQCGVTNDNGGDEWKKCVYLVGETVYELSERMGSHQLLATANKISKELDEPIRYRLQATRIRNCNPNNRESLESEEIQCGSANLLIESLVRHKLQDFMKRMLKKHMKDNA